MSIGFAYTTTYTCNASCPMLIPVSQTGMRDGYDYSQCLCETSQGVPLNATGYPANDIPLTEEAQKQRYDAILSITGVSGSTGLNCYICDSSGSPTVYEPCPSFDRCTLPKMRGFRPATINSTQVCNTRPKPGIPMPFAWILQSPAVTNRELVNLLILIMSVLFAVQTLCAMIIAYAYFRFKDKYDSDWGKLTPMEVNLGIMAKLLPNLARLANLISLIFLAMGSKFFFSDQVCKYDENNVGQVVFFPTISGYLIAMIVVWLFFCFLGGLFHNTWPRDTSFYNPRFPEEPEQNLFVKIICRGWCILTNFGP
jgi:hypothetical protein